GDTAGMPRTVRAVARVLGPHMKLEEHGLFPALAEDFPDRIAQLETEHRSVDGVLADAVDQAVLAAPTWADQLIQAMDLLRAHILKEQDGVYPAALALLRTEEWEAVEAERARAGGALSGPAGAGRREPAGTPR